MDLRRWLLGLGFPLLLVTHPGMAEGELVTAQVSERQVILTGFTRARTVLTLSSEVPGKVEQVFADIGQPVPEDGRFSCLDKTFINLELEQNRAEQGRQKVEIEYFNKQVTRFSQLVSKQSSAQTQLDDAERGMGVARQQLKALQTQAASLRERKKRHCAKTPAGWLVIERYIEPSQWLNSGEPLAKIGDFSSLLIPFALSMDEYKSLQAHQAELEVRLPDLDVVLPARIERISPAFDEASHKIRLDLEIHDGLEQRRGGLRAELALKLPDASGTLLVPTAALRKRYEEHWLTRPDGKEVKVVYLGKGAEEMARIISSEIEPGDQFLLPDKQSLSE